MKPLVRIGLAGGVLVLLVLTIWLARPKPEPEYQGRTLSDWLAQLVSVYPRKDQESLQALRAMGDAAVRSLTKTAVKADSPMTTKILQYSDRLPFLERVLPSRFWARYLAVIGLGEMGTNAASAIPSLRELESSDEPMLRTAARAALVLIENQSIEAIVAECFDYRSTNSANAYGLILLLGPHAEIAVPKLLEEIQSTNPRTRLRASTLLGTVGIESPECVYRCSPIC